MSDNLRITDERADFDPETYARIVIALARFLAASDSDDAAPGEDEEGASDAAA